MLKTIPIIMILSNLLFSALPPLYQNDRDLNVMLKFLENHPIVKSGLNSIDFDAKIIYYNQECRVYFKRKSATHPKGWVGPAEPLIFDKANCKY